MAADDAALCVMHWKRDVVAIKQSDQTLRVEPFDKLGGVATLLGKLLTMFDSDPGDACLPIERQWSGPRRLAA